MSGSALVNRRPLLPAYLLLLVAEAPGHGYELTDRLKDWGFELAGPGPVYRELRLLESRGLVRSAWSAPESGPVPRVYEITTDGRAALDGAAADVSGLEQLLADFQVHHQRLPRQRSSNRNGRPRR
jgi:DNA-binding PadR family transcriptional regulator